MNTTIDIKTGDFAVSTSPNILSTIGIGSCIVVCFYEKKYSVGSLAHIMLPKASASMGQLNPKRFVDTAIPAVLKELNKRGVQPHALEASLIGGASMFSKFTELSTIGMRNVQAAEELLRNYSIPIRTKDVGGSSGRSVRFYLENGDIEIIKHV